MKGYPVTFEYQGKVQKGLFVPVSGGGSNTLWHLTVDNYYWGQLFYGQQWQFYSNTMPELSDLAEYFGWIVTSWNDCDPDGKHWV